MQIDGKLKIHKPSNFGMRKDGRMVMPIGGGINANMHLI